MKKGKAIAKGPGDPGLQYQLKHFELSGETQVQQFDQAQSVDLLGLAPGELGARRRSRSGQGTAEGAEGDDGKGLGASTGKAGKGRPVPKLGSIKFVKEVTDITVLEGKTAAFECAVSDAEAVVTWLVNDKTPDAERGQILAVGKTRRLVLQHCQLNEDQLVVTAILDEITKCSGKLFVKEAPFEFVEPLKPHKVKQGANCELECTVNKLNVALEWFKDDQPITDIKEIVDGFVHKFIVPNVQDKDKGTYAAKFGTAQTNCLVDVLGKLYKRLD